MELVRTDSTNTQFIELVKILDEDLAIKDGNEHAYYAQFNKLDKIKHVIIVMEDDIAIGCGAIKEYATDIMEVKRMFTAPSVRGKGIATKVLKELEKWAAELGYKKLILETGKRQTEAIILYQKNGYIPIPNYGQYAIMDNSLCFEKDLTRL